MKPAIPCPKCKGKGNLPIAGPLARTLALFRGKGELTALDCAGKFPEKVATAQNNRLERLVQMGLLQKRRVGKAWRYSKT